jgi:beta-xylosidase
MINVVAALLVTANASLVSASAQLPKTVTFTYQAAQNLGQEPGVCRRDPSDVIRAADTYYVWYTKVVESAPLYPSGYNGTVWYATSTDEGHTWQERGKAVGCSETGFDSFGVFTPNILTAEGRFFLYYTAVSKGFVNKGYTEIGKTAIGVAVADHPDGPWTKYDGNPVLMTSEDHARFDSYRVDDACLIAREGNYWLYYKGRPWEHTPRETKMGVAVADAPTGPFVKQNDGRPVQDSGHEVLVWPYHGGIMSLVSNTGPNGRTLQFAPDGLHFEVIVRDLKNQPNAPGIFRRDLSDEPDYDGPVSWGISMMHSRPPYLVRYTCAF